MSFLSPLFLLGLPLVAIPIAIHLLNRRQQKVLPWGAMRFLVSASTRRRRLWRMSDLLLLALRVLAILFIVSALARPLLPVTWLGHSGPRAVVLVIDTSMSTAAREGGQTVFDQIHEKADALLDGLTESDSLQVLIARKNPVWLQETPVEANPNELRRIRSALHQLEPSLGSANLSAALHEALDSPEDEEKMIRIISVLSDGQSYGWDAEEETPWAELERKLANKKRPTLINLDLVTHAAGTEANLSIEELRTLRTVTAIHQPITVEALVRNRGEKATEASVVHWYIEDQSLGISSVPPLSPGSSAPVKVTHAFESAGHFDLWCQIDTQDVLEADNEAHVIFTISDELPVLVVDGSSEVDPLATDVGYLLASLGFEEDQSLDAPAWDSGFAPKLIPLSELDMESLEPYRCVILANPRRLNATATDRLKHYVEAGGGLWVVLGDAVRPDEFNESWYRDGIGLSPLPLLTTIGDPEDREAFKHLQPPPETHPATQLLADLQRLDIDRVQVFRRHQFDELRALETSILLRLEHGDALAVEQNVGQGRVIFLAVPLGLAWSNFPVCQSYVALVHEWIWYLATPSFERHNLSLGESIQVTVTEPNSNSEFSIKLPDNETAIMPVRPQETSSVLRFSQTQVPGAYTVQSTDQSFRSPFYIQRDPQESSLIQLAPEEMAVLTRIPGIQVGAGGLSIPKQLDLEIPTTPIATTLLMILLAVVVGELLLAAWCTYQRSPGMSAVKMEG